MNTRCVVDVTVNLEEEMDDKLKKDDSSKDKPQPTMSKEMVHVTVNLEEEMDDKSKKDDSSCSSQ